MAQTGMQQIVTIGIIVLLALSSFNQELHIPDIDPLFFDSTSQQSYGFQYSPEDNSYLQKLCREFRLHDLIENCETQLEIVQRVTHWVHNLWDHDGSNVPEKNDPISILQEVKEDGKNFRCVEYSIVINGSLNALGIPSRVIGLKTQDVETREFGAGHVVVEAYLEEFDKWIFIDGQWNTIPLLYGVPLNGVEFQRALAEKDKNLTLSGFSRRETHRYLKWIHPYLFYFDTPLDNRFVPHKGNEKLMLVPLGAKNPTIFQQKWPIENMIYTNELLSFYEKPIVVD